MSVLEMVKTKVKELTDKSSGPAGDLLNSAKSAVAHGLDGASKFVDDKTNHKYSSTIHTGVDKAKHLLGEDAAEQDDKDSAPSAESSEPAGPSEPAGSAGSADSQGSAKPSGSAEPTESTKPEEGGETP
jgi:hypothetical protein